MYLIFFLGKSTYILGCTLWFKDVTVCLFTGNWFIIFKVKIELFCHYKLNIILIIKGTS